MQRELKYRGRSKETKEWVYGSYVHIAAGNELEGDIHDIVSLNGNKYPVIRDTVGQFTGLTDKNGKEIYEGDIMRIRTPNRSTQTHHDPYCVEPLEPAIKESIEVVSFNGGCFVLGEPSLGELMCWRILPYDKESAIEAFQSVDWAGEEGEMEYLLDVYKLASEEELIKYMGAEIIGNVCENPELLKPAS